MDQYAQDFQVEREAREKQQGELINLKDTNDNLMRQIENLRQELNINTNNRMREQRYYMQQQQQEQGRWQQHQPQQPLPNNYSQSANRNYPQRYPDQHARFNNRSPYDYGGNNSNLYGRGGNSENFYEEIDSEEVEVHCPKCGGAQPDRDSLQVHLVDCLDK